MYSLSREVDILLADDHAPIRSFLTILLEDAGMHVVGEAADGREAVRQCEHLCPDIVLLDISMPVLNGFEAAREITKLSPATKIIFLTGHSGAVLVAEAFRVGGVAFVLKDRAARDLLAAIKAVLEGKTYISGDSAA